MPQLDPSVFTPQIIWLVISFLALYLIMAYNALPMVGKVLEEREDRMADDLEHAERLKSESVEIEAEYDKSLAEAKNAALISVQDAKTTLQTNLDAKRAEADAKIAAKLHEVEANIKIAKAEAMLELEDIAVEACQAIVVKLSGSKLSKDDAKAKVQAEINLVTGKGA